MSKKMREFLSIVMTVGVVLTLASILILTFAQKHIFAIPLFVGVLAIMFSLCMRGIEDVLYRRKENNDKEDQEEQDQEGQEQE